MGLHSGIDASDKYPMVFDFKLARDSTLPQWHGGNDTVENSTQGYRQVQSNGVRRRCSGMYEFVQPNACF